MAGLKAGARREKACLRYYGLQECTMCLDIKEFTGFPRNRSATSGYNTRCSECVLEYNAQKNYGITRSEYDAYLSAPCAICGAKSEALDHDHVTGAIRAALCHPCNRGIGLLGDDPDRLEAASTYIKEHKGV